MPAGSAYHDRVPPEQVKPSLRHRLMAYRWTLFDAVLAVGLFVATIQDLGADQDTDEIWYWFALPMMAALLIRRRYPMLAVILAGTAALLLHLDPTIGVLLIDLAVPLTVYTLASTVLQSRRRAVTGLAIALICVSMVSAVQVVAVSQAAEQDPTSIDTTMTAQEQLEVARKKAEAARSVTGSNKPAILDIPVKDFVVAGGPSMKQLIADAVARALSALLAIALAFAIGDGVRSRRAHLMTLEKRATDLEREQHQRVALSLAAERARITRELHDVVAHALSVMVVQAQGGAAALRRHPDRTETALHNVITTGRTSLAEMRRLLDLVRQDPSGDPRHAPQPGVDALPELIDGVRAAGTPVTFTVEGDPVPLPLTVDLSAFRIAQEALTNTIKHAGGTGVSAQVRLAYRPDEIELEVTDDGGGPARQALEGNGLRGIAERIAVLGGELEAGVHSVDPKDPDRPGWRLRASLPLRPKGMTA